MALPSKLREMIQGRKSEIERGLDKAEQVVSDRTGGKYDEQMKSVRQKADRALSDDDRPDAADGRQDEPPRDNPDTPNGGDKGPTQR